MLTPAVGTSFAVAGMTSATGRCHTFDERADGYARGEACCAASLRREDEAASLLARGSAVRQDGRSASLTAPNGLAQQGLLRASLEDACMAASDLSCAEAHGTGTALGDPIEAGSLASTVLMPIGGSSSVGLASGKANVGHAEPAAGATGMLKLALQLQHALIAPNAHLRLLNPHVGSAIGGLSCALSQQAQPCSGAAGGVSSFGYSGTIAHAVIEHSSSSITRPTQPAVFVWRRRSFAWRSPAHQLAQHRSDVGSEIVYRTPTSALVPLVADHIVQGRVVFPGAGYLEMARASLDNSSASLQSIIFMQPLVLTPIDAVASTLECAITTSRNSFSIRDADSPDSTVFCQGGVSSGEPPSSAPLLLHAASRDVALNPADLYDRCHQCGLQYGPQYRRLSAIWLCRQANLSIARLRSSPALIGNVLHPADLDAALQVSLAPSIAAIASTPLRLPFSVGAASLSVPGGKLWAWMAEGHDGSADGVLMNDLGHSAATLDGFKRRAISSLSPDLSSSIYS